MTGRRIEEVEDEFRSSMLGCSWLFFCFFSSAPFLVIFQHDSNSSSTNSLTCTVPST